MTSERLLVIYHGACRDGFGAAWCVWRRFPGSEFVPAFYGAEPPDVTGRDVVMVDFSYPLDVMTALADACASLLVLDHHKTAEAALTGFSHSKANVEFDMNRSGAGMAWDHFFPGQPRPWIVDYVEDRDLWRHALPDGPAVNAFLGTLRYDFEHWYQTSRLAAEDVVKLGQVVEDKIRHYVIEVAKNAVRINFEGYDVPIVNAPQVDISELVGFLSGTERFAMGWWQRSDGMFSYSLRSRGDFDVSELAKRHGGGGHKNAAGFLSSRLLTLSAPGEAGEASMEGMEQPESAQESPAALPTGER